MNEFVEKYLDPDSTALIDKKIHEIEISRVLRSVGVEGPVLDMGYGHGVVAETVIAQHDHCTVVEISSALVEHAERTFGRQIDVYHSSFEEFSPPEKFRTVLATAVLHHVSDPLLVLKRIRSWLLPGGTLLVTVPNAESIHRAIGVAQGWEPNLRSISITGRQMGVVRTFTSSELKGLIQEAGFSEVQQLPSFLKFLTYEQMSSWSEKHLKLLFDIAALSPMNLHATLIFRATLTPEKAHRED